MNDIEIARIKSRAPIDIVAWLEKNVPGCEWVIDESGSPVIIMEESDAIVFKLTFGL